MKRPERSPTQVYPERLKSVQTDFAINHKGIVAQCEEIMRETWAVVEVVKPGKRQPKRKLIITQAMKKAGYYGTTPASSKRDKR